MGRRSYPAPSLDAAFAWLDVPLPAAVQIRPVLIPRKKFNRLFVCVEIVRLLPGGAMRVWRRHGEEVTMGRMDEVQGALFRACIRAAQEVGQYSPDELVKRMDWDALHM